MECASFCPLLLLCEEVGRIERDKRHLSFKPIAMSKFHVVQIRGILQTFIAAASLPDLCARLLRRLDAGRMQPFSNRRLPLKERLPVCVTSQASKHVSAHTHAPFASRRFPLLPACRSACSLDHASLKSSHG